MAACGFICSRNALAALNILYLFISVILIGVGAYGIGVSYIQSVSITGGIVAAGVFLFIVAILGIFGASRHHQVALFFYMIILFLIFLVQFAVAVACLSFNENQRHILSEKAWLRASNKTLLIVQHRFKCCGFLSTEDVLLAGPDCSESSCYSKECNCWQRLDFSISEALRVTGYVGLFFSFTEVIGIWLASRFRNQKDPRANPNAFL